MKNVLKYAVAVIIMSALIICLPELSFTAKADSSPSANTISGNEAYNAMIAEGSKPERRTVCGFRSVVPGLYFEKKVAGVGFYNLPGTKITDTKVKVYDADNVNCPYALAVANYVALTEKRIVGPCINVMFNKMNDQKGNLNEIFTMCIGLPEGLKVDGIKYGVIAVMPGGAFKYIADTGILPGAVTIPLESLKNYDTSSVFFAIVMNV
ncbi:MAG: hypothetical protein MJ133_04375 [Lachnospiraceae bacterium]|nr:hypothetical protein [Lachnospiraceae bacterium]